MVRKLKSRGFTLIELMIVVAIIGILAAIAIPRFADMLEKAREGATKGNLGSMKSAASIYYGDHEGIWPYTLSAQTTYNFSLYMDVVPRVKVTGKFDINTSTVPSNYTGEGVTHVGMNTVPTTQSTGWMYDSVKGNVYVNSTLIDSKNIPYSYYGYE